MSHPAASDLSSFSGQPRDVRVFTALDQLAGAWDGLAHGSGSPLHHYAWVRACADRFSTPDDLCVVAVGDPCRPSAIAPLVKRRDGLPRLELIGVGELHEPMDLIYRDPAVVLPLARALSTMGLPVFLPRVAADSPTVAAVSEAWAGGVVIRWPSTGCPFIDLNERWAEGDPPLNPGRRSDLRRARRNAAMLGPVTSQIVSPSPVDLEPLIEEMIRVEGSGWKSRSGTALAMDGARSLFFRSYALAASRAGVLRLCFLRIGDRTAAVQFAIESEERFWLLKIGYDEAFARVSPGMLLLAETVQYAAQRRLRRYEFLGVPEPWTSVWADQVRECVSLRAFPSRSSGLTAFAADVAQAGRRKLGRLLMGSP